MKPLSILFIEPRGRQANVFENYMGLPLMGSLILGTILSQAGHRVEIWNENILKKSVDPLDIRADVVCITALTLNATRAIDLARSIRLHHAKVRIILGGIHASLLPEEFTDFADHVVVGEGESVIVDLVEGRVTDRLVHGSPIEDMDALPLLDYNLLLGASTMTCVPMMTSRGCPFDCNFCTVTRIFGRRYRKQSAERVLAEIRNALAFFKTHRFFIYDDNLAVDIGRLEAIVDGIIQENMRISWTAQVRADIAKHPDLLAKMFQSGCSRVYIGFESISDDSLKALNKSQTRADIEKAIEVIHAQGIFIHGMFMFGDDHDTTASFQETAHFASRHDIDTVQFMALTPFPGTRIYDRLEAEGRLIHRNWDYYDGMHTVFRPAQVSPAELQAGTVAAYRHFYSMERSFCGILHMIFNIGYDALVWNFSRAVHYDPYNIFLKIGARFIISDFVRMNQSYDRYLADYPSTLGPPDPA